MDKNAKRPSLKDKLYQLADEVNKEAVKAVKKVESKKKKKK